MMIPLLIAWLLLVIAGLGLAYWVVMAYRVHRSLRDDPRIRAGLALPDPCATDAPAPKVSIIIPAHNEEEVIEACVTSLRAQRYEPIEIIVVLDRCTDETEAVLRRHAADDTRIILIENETSPEDWAGKCYAASLGAARATGEWLLFTDADTVFDRDLVRAAVALAADRGLSLLSLLSTLRSEHAFERIAQPVASLNLMRMYPIERVNRPGSVRPFANGQFMLFARAAYEAVGGHVAVKDDLLEDIAFARRVAEHGGQCGLYLADGMLTCAMYESLAEFTLGWKRIFIEACKRKPRRLRKNAWRVLVGGVILPAMQLAALIAGIVLLLSGDPPFGALLMALVVVTVAVQLAVLWRVYRFAGAPPRAALLYPAGSWIVFRIMTEGAGDLSHHRPIPWAGRTYHLEPR